MNIERSAGVLCHISSLSGKYGIGSLGKEAHAFARMLKKRGFRYWQMLPLVQTGFGDSPYQSVSSDSGNPYFIDLEELKKQKLLTKKELNACRKKNPIDYGALYEQRYKVLKTAFSRFNFENEDFRAFVKSGKAEDYALFMTAKSVYGGTFCDWDASLRDHEEGALEALRTDHHEEYLFWQFLQYEFDLQWRSLREECRRIGLKIIGDIPLYVAYDSADVWVHSELFKLDREKKCEKIAGVPPDYFSEKGQLWGNPIYDWAEHEKTDFKWWKKRFKNAFEFYDVVRIDHFRGIDRYYEIDAGAEDATRGEWKDGPKEKLFEGVVGEIIAEDLGVVDGGVEALLKKTGFPGMKVLLFAFDSNADNPYLPHLFDGNCVCYTGTHDNDTVAGYCKGLSTEELILFRSQIAAEMQRLELNVPIGDKPEEMSNAIVHLCLASKARLAVVPVQDILGLDNESRMNTPGKAYGNWRFRLNCLPAGKHMRRLQKMIKIYGRII